MKKVICPLLVAVLSLHGRTDLLVVALDGLKGLVGDALLQEGRRGAEEAVAALDVVVEEGEGPPGRERFEPEVDLAQFDGHGVDVDAEDAAADHVADGRTDGVGGRLLIARADRRQTLADTVGSRDEEVAGAAGGIADLQVENALFWGGGRGMGSGQWGVGGGGLLVLFTTAYCRLPTAPFAFYCVVQHGVEGGIEKAVDQARRRVVAAGGFALVAGGGG